MLFQFDSPFSPRSLASASTSASTAASSTRVEPVFSLPAPTSAPKVIQRIMSPSRTEPTVTTDYDTDTMSTIALTQTDSTVSTAYSTVSMVRLAEDSESDLDSLFDDDEDAPPMVDFEGNFRSFESPPPSPYTTDSDSDSEYEVVAEGTPARHRRRPSSDFSSLFPPEKVEDDKPSPLKPRPIFSSKSKRRLDVISFSPPSPPRAPVFFHTTQSSSASSLTYTNTSTQSTFSLTPPQVAPKEPPPPEATPLPIPGPFIIDRVFQNTGYCRVVAGHYSSETYTDGKRKAVCIKVFKKKKVVKENHIPSVSAEILAYKQLQRSLDRVGRRFLMYLHGALQDQKRLYYVMDLMSSDLMHIIKHSPEEIPKHVKTWTAQAARGILTMHKSGIIHRDLKPENFLIDSRYNLRITDLGCSYVHPLGKGIQKYKTYSTHRAGTYAYTAPELWDEFNRVGYNGAVDWWALGCVLYELVSAPHSTLFENYNARLWFLEICKMYGDLQEEHLHFPSQLDSDAVDLILGLLRRNPHQRFDYQRLRKHDFFRNADGSSEFERMDVRAAERPKRLGPSTAGERLVRPVIYNPIDIPDDTRNPFATTTYAWINPGGDWGTPSASSTQ